MLPTTHFIFSLLLAAGLFNHYGWLVIFVIAGGVFIDIDHYFWHIYNKKGWNFLKVYKHYKYDYAKFEMIEKIKSEIYIFHNVEFLIIVVVMSFFSAGAFMFLLGLLLHYILDFIDEARNGIDKIKSVSFFAWLVRTKNGKKAR